MFNFCVCRRARRAEMDPSSKHYQAVQKTLSEEEQVMLELIYVDLANRNHENLLTFENFLLFFGLTGLWGAKLFRVFSGESRKLITKEEFFYGLSRTAKAPHSQKIKQLFNFFKDEEDNGIKFIDFTKMLYNYSRDELKEILMEDKYMIPELNRAISRNLEQEPTSASASLVSLRSFLPKKETVIELNYEEPNKEDVTCFGKNYAEFSEYRDPGTILEVKLNDFTYKVNYCNMITLVKEFAKKIYASYNIDIKNGIFTYEQFTEWIQSHRKLFETYYTSFHIDIWSYYDSDPNFLSKIEKSFTGKMRMGKHDKPKGIYAMLVGDVLIIAESYKTRRNPFKVICLEGLNMIEIYDSTGFGIEISHRDEHYQSCILYFKSQAEQQSYLQSFQLYEGDTLHDLYNSHEMIGTGKFSIVYRCTSKQTNKSFALKDISTEKLTSQAIATLDNQSEIMKIISHPQIVKYQQTIRSKSHIYIIAEYIYGKDLYQYVRKRKSLSEYISAFIIGKIIEATIYLHSLEIIHRDLKPENIMVMLKKRNNQLSSSTSLEQFTDEECIENIKIIDFGLANHQSEFEKTHEMHGIAGTPNYIAPEIILGEKPSAKSDIFSIGSILYFLLSGKLAFAYHNMEYTLLRTARGDYDMKDQIWEGISEEAKDLIRQLLCVDPQQRIGLQQALNHRWFDVVTKKRNANSNSPKTNEETSCCSSKKEGATLKLEAISQINVQALMQNQLKNKAKKSGL